MRVAGQIGFGDAYFDTDLLVYRLDGKEVIGDGEFFGRGVPLPAALPALDEDSGTMDGETIDEFEWQMFVEDEDICEVFITEEVVDFPEFTMGTGDHLAGFNQFQ